MLKDTRHNGSHSDFGPKDKQIKKKKKLVALVVLHPGHRAARGLSSHLSRSLVPKM